MGGFKKKKKTNIDAPTVLDEKIKLGTITIDNIVKNVASACST